MGYFNPIPNKNLFVDTILKTIIDILVVVLLAIFVIYFYCDKATIVGNSMSKELSNGEVVLINKLSYRVGTPDRFDVIAYKNDSGISVKRIIGLPGEKIQIIDSKIYVDGEVIEDIFFEGTFESGYVNNEMEIGPDEYFVMGDNRNVSEDSRFSYVGNVKYADILGKAWFIVAPFNRMGFVE